ncbi:phosphatase PAP2 family protein [Peredibacter sp. HCB2-198]|uniref:phosphatase PAP2 family protein n=1 Tax=Peredibacter sp. HCB2-198 TaxID=3383025 RepID=UPI0038B4FBB2
MKQLILVLSLIWFLPVWAQDLTYLSPDSIDLNLIPAPPAVNSEEDLADLAEVLRWQTVRTEADCAKSAFESEGFATSFFGPPYGPLTQAEAQKLVALQEVLFKEVMIFSRVKKDEWGRVRPYNRDPRIVPCVRRPRSLSYPSGHTTIAYVAAKTFSLIYPEKAEAFDQRAKEISLGRVIGGVHHPLDTVAGKVMGEMIFESLIKSPKFLDDVKALTK